MANFFGWQFKREVKQSTEEQLIKKLPADDVADGSLNIGVNGNFMSYGVDFENNMVENEIELITSYREIAIQPEIEKAVDDIINEFFSYDEDTYPVKVNLDNIDEKILAEKTKEKIYEEFNDLLDLLNFKSDAYEIVRRWYVDGRLYYQKMIDPKNVKGGLSELRYIDPRKIKKVREEVKNKKKSNTYYEFEQGDEIEYYIYNPKGIDPANPNGMKLTTDSICFINSGLFDKSNKTILSYLHKTIRPYNLLRQLEDSSVVYVMARSPERRIFGVEVGNMPPLKTEQYVKEQMINHRRKMVFDPNTGKVRDDRRYMSLLEDYWFPKRDGKGTTVDTLSSNINFGDLANLDYFRKKLYEALNVPASRFDSSSTFGLGRSSEITRDELKFSKFISRLRKRFSAMFDDLLKTQLMLKGIMTSEEWELIKNDLYYDFIEDNFFSELKWSEIWNNRITNLQNAEILVQEKYVSKKWVRQNMLKLTDEEFADMKKDIEAEAEEAAKEEARLNPPEDSFGGNDSSEDDSPPADIQTNPSEEDIAVNEKISHLFKNSEFLVENLNKLSNENKQLENKLETFSENLSVSKQENMNLKLELNRYQNELNEKVKVIEGKAFDKKAEKLIKKING